MKNTIIRPVAFTLALLAILHAKAQQPYSLIPGNARYVLCFHPGQLKEKSGDLDYRQFLMPLTGSAFSSGYDGNRTMKIAGILSEPDSFGISMKDYIYIYQTGMGNLSGTAYILSLSDPSLFTSRLNREYADRSFNHSVRSSAGAVFYLNDKMSVTVKENMALVFVKDFVYSGYEEVEVTSAPEELDSAYFAEKSAENIRLDSQFYENLNGGKVDDYEQGISDVLDAADTGISGRAERRKLAAVREEMNRKYEELLHHMESLLTQSTGHIGTNRNFARMHAGGHDAFILVNTVETFRDHSVNPFRWSNRYLYGEVQKETPAQGKMKLLQDLYSYYSIDFSNGKAVLNFLNTYNNDVFPYMKKIYGVKQDKKLFRYIDGSDLLGYISVAADAAEMGKFYELLYTEFLQSVPKSEREENIVPAMRLVYALLDKEILYNTLDGRAIFACTGFTETRLKYNTFSYDDEFNKKESTEERIVKQPRMILAASVGNRENAKKLFGIISTFSVFRKVSDNVISFQGNSRSPFNIWIGLTDDALIISNDGNSVLGLFNKEAVRTPLPKEVRKEMLAHSMSMRIYSSRIMKGINDQYFSGRENLPWFSEMMSSLGDFEMYDSKPQDNTYGATAVFHLKDSNVNSLYRLLKMMQAINVN